MVTLGKGVGRGMRDGGEGRVIQSGIVQIRTHTHTHIFEEVQLIERLAQLAVALLLGTWSS